MDVPMRLSRPLSSLALVLGLVLLGRLALVWWARWTYPFDLEWMEGGMLAHVWRLEQGLPLYTWPSEEWIPFIYPPGYAQLLAWLSPVVGIGYAQARAVSILGTLAGAAAIPWLTWRHTGRVLPGLLGAAAFLGTWDNVGCFFDLVRTDGLSVGLVAWAVVLSLETSPRSRDVGALLLCGAFAVKQNFALWGVPLALALWTREGWRPALRFGLVSAVPALGWTAYQQWLSDGLYLTYILEVPATHGMVGERGFPGTPRETSLALPGALLLVCAYVVEKGRGRALLWAALVLGVAIAGWNLSVDGRMTDGLRGVMTSCGMGALTAAIVASLGMTLRRDVPWRWLFGAGVGGVALVSACLMRAHVGGFVNVFIPLFWVLCAGAAWACAHWEARGGALAALAPLLLGGQLAYDLATLDEARYLPSPASREAGEAVVAAVRQVEGPVFAPFSPWLVYQAGGEPGVHLISIWDVAKPRSPFGDVNGLFREAFASHHYAAVLDGNRRLQWGLDATYGEASTLVPPGRFRPVNGYTAYPSRLRRPRPAANATPDTP